MSRTSSEDAGATAEANLLPPEATNAAAPRFDRALYIQLASGVAEGRRWQEVAASLGLDLDAAAEMMTADDWIETVTRLTPTSEEVRAYMASTAMRAARRLSESLEAPGWKEAHSAAKDILDRTGLTPTRKVLNVTVRLDQEKMKQARGILRELGGPSDGE